MKARTWIVLGTPRLAPYLFGVMVLLALGLLLVHRLLIQHRLVEEERLSRQEAVARGTKVIVARVVRAPPTVAITVTSDVNPYQRVQLFPNINGFLRTVTVEKGKEVRAGDALAVIEARDSEQLLRGARLSLRSKSRQLSRSLSLGPGLVSPQELDRIETDVALASAEVTRLEALKAYEVLRAPFDGVVVSRNADPGALVVIPSSMSDPMPVLEIWDTSRVRVQGRVGQAEAASVQPDDPVELWTDERPTERVKARITRTTGALDPRTRTMLFEVELRCPCDLLPGAFAHVQLNVKTPPALSISVDAVTVRRGDPVVLVVADGRGTFRKVQLGRTDGRTVRVLSGLAEGELVVLYPSDALADGVALRAVLPGESSPE